MRALVCEEFGPPEGLKWVEVDRPEPQPDEALVRVTATGIGYVDGLMVQGKYQVKPPLPYYPGSEFAGCIEALGSEAEGIAGLQVRQRVIGMGNGACSDYVKVCASNLIALPDSVDDATGAGMFINYATALYGLRDCGALQADESILILGAAGGVGSAAIATAKAMGAHVIAAASNEKKRDATLAYGADEVVDYSQPDWRDDLKALTAQRGLNLVYDPVGGDVSEPAFRSLSPGGRFLVVGFAAGSIPAIPLNLALLKRSSIVGVDWGGEARADPSINGKLMRDLMGWIRSGKLTPATVTTRSIEKVHEALDDQLAGRIVGKLVLTR
ncbi:MAG: NADPH:quinone oxidoreductase family protein [Pseudomonadota bacterium]